MRITSRRGTIVFFITLGTCLVALAVALNVGWIILNWRKLAPLLLGVILFGVIIAGMIVFTIFLVREIRRNEQHDSFINAMTHELKTPITSLRLYLETLESRQLAEEQRREFYRTMREDTDRLMQMMEQVLKAGEVRGRTAVESRRVDLGQLLRECTDLARTRHHLTDETLLYLGPANGLSPTVIGDPDDLRTAFHNVLDNAIKYSNGKVDVRVELAVPDADHVVVQVRDQGVGIPRAELKQVFRRFYRVRNLTVSHVKGSGLGLFIVRTIIRRHGGEAMAESEGEGRGTTLTIRLPRAA